MLRYHLCLNMCFFFFSFFPFNAYLKKGRCCCCCISQLLCIKCYLLDMFVAISDNAKKRNQVQLCNAELNTMLFYGGGASSPAKQMVLSRDRGRVPAECQSYVLQRL